MKIRTLLPALSLLVALHAPARGEALEAGQAFEFPFNAGDSLVVQDDYGRIRIEPSSTDKVEINVRRIAASAEGMKNVSVVCRKVGTRIYVQAYFYRFAAESVFIRIRAPLALDIMAGGANPAVDIQNMGGFARIQTLTGFITAANLTGSASLFTENGDIEYTAAVQPQGDLRFETIQGNIRCRLRKDLNLHGWLRAGSRISWGTETAPDQRFLERQLGVGGPLLLAASQAGGVAVELLDAPSQQSQFSRIEPTATRRSDPAPSTLSAPAEDRKAPVSSNTSTNPQAPPRQPEVAADSRPPITASGDGGDFSLKVDVNLVNVNASVRDSASNRAVANLTADDFELFEDGRSQTVAKFANTEAPFSLLLLLDVSGSTGSYIDLIQSASIRFTEQIKPGDHIALATFNSRTELRRPFTDDRSEIERAIRRIHSGGGTAFYDALSTSVTRTFKGVEGRKAIVVFTDGIDNQLTGDFGHGSTISFGDLFQQIRERDILIYTIFLDTEGQGGMSSPFPGRRPGGTLGGILGDIILGRGGGGPIGRGPVGRPGNGGPQAYEQARGELEQIAGQTGGRMYAPRSIQDLSGAYDEIANDLRVQYTLGYYSNSRPEDGRWRTITVDVRDRPELVVRHRRGYYGGRK